jgi:hypothetical protein
VNEVKKVYVSTGNVSFLSMLAVVFITLKLTSVITWSWWWVTAPLWGPVAIVIALFSLVGVSAGILWAIMFLQEAWQRRKKRKW